MSSAFVKEGENQWLHDVAPSLNALMVYLQRENGGLRIYEKKSYYNATHGRDVYEMTDGLTYAKKDDGSWYIIWD